MPRTDYHRYRQEKPKQLFTYTFTKNDQTYSAGQSRKADCKTMNDIHGNGDMTLVQRLPLYDEINTEYGFMTREAYLDIKNSQD